MGRIIIVISVVALVGFGILAAIPIVRHQFDPSYRVPTSAWVLAGTVVTGSVTLAGFVIKSRRERPPKKHLR